MTFEQFAEVHTGLYINGEERTTAEVMHVVDPARPDKCVGHAASASAADVGDAVSAAKDSFPMWSRLTPAERARWMESAIADAAVHRDEDARILSMENGKIVGESIADSMVFELRWNLALSLLDQIDGAEVLPAVAGQIAVSTEVSYQPLGVVSIIVPFNWPIAILGAALPYALLAGNTVVVKPPPTCPLATARSVQRIAEKLPPGVLNVVTGNDEKMTGLIKNTDVSKVCFTGSVGGGRKMMELASTSLTRLTLELGGNDAAIFLEDAILDDDHLDRLYCAIFDTTGQVCMSAKRVYVHRSRLDEIVEALAARLENVQLGHGLDGETTMGPLHSSAQKSLVEHMIQQAKREGAVVREFGGLPAGELSGGNFVRPAIVVDPDQELDVVIQEQFGPVIPVIPFDTEDDVVAMANDTWGGLCGSVWSGSSEAASRVARHLVCGYVWINDHGAARLDLRAPFGGMKQSGFGREQGIEGIRDFQDTRSIASFDTTATAES